MTIPPLNVREKRSCSDCLFWNFQDGYCWIGMDEQNRPVEAARDVFLIGVCDRTEAVFPCQYNFTPAEVKEIIDRADSTVAGPIRPGGITGCRLW